MSSVKEKLKKFQIVCEEKLRKIEHFKSIQEKNEKLLFESARLNLQQAQTQFEIGIAQLEYSASNT
jgi:hypothetical protein